MFVLSIPHSVRIKKDFLRGLSSFLTPWNRPLKGLLEYYHMLKSQERLDNVWHATLTCLFWKTQLLTSPTAWSSSSSTLYSKNVAFVVFRKKTPIAVGIVHYKIVRKKMMRYKVIPVGTWGYWVSIWPSCRRHTKNVAFLTNLPQFLLSCLPQELAHHELPSPSWPYNGLCLNEISTYRI